MAALIVLDTNIIIYFLEDRLDGPLPDGDLAVSVISEIELLSHSGLDASSEASIRKFIGLVERIDLTPAIKESAIALRRQHRLTIPDAIIAASALVTQSVLLTNDAKLSGIADVTVRGLPVRN